MDDKDVGTYFIDDLRAEFTQEYKVSIPQVDDAIQRQLREIGLFWSMLTNQLKDSIAYTADEGLMIVVSALLDENRIALS